VTTPDLQESKTPSIMPLDSDTTDASPTCPLCKRNRSTSFPISYLLDQKKFDARKCLSCNFVYLSPRPTRHEIQLMYSDEYFLHDGADFGAHSAQDYETAAQLGSVKFPEILGWIKKYQPEGKFFEIGCGMGYFLDYARQHGFEVSGIEFAALGASACKEKFGLEVLQSSFEKYPIKDNMYNVIFMGDVLEHFNEPLEMLQKAHVMIKKSGIIAVEVPSMFNSITGRLAVAGLNILGKTKKMPMPPYHVNEFTPRTLALMLKTAGFGTVRIVQRIKSPQSITLRGNVFEKTTKKFLQYPNYFITRSAGVLGDRLLGIGTKP
jgi:2-polyprenyl-3-methyl-5-hydroxy-6-metoxy-1,4-benzoquinol methylase